MPRAVSALAVIRLHAKGSERRFFDDPQALAQDARAKLEQISSFAMTMRQTPYLARLRPMFAQRSDGDYDHLSRLKEWNAEGAEGAGEES